MWMIVVSCVSGVECTGVGVVLTGIGVVAIVLVTGVCGKVSVLSGVGGGRGEICVVGDVVVCCVFVGLCIDMSK